MIRFISIIVLIISTTAVFCQNEKKADEAFDNGKALLSGGGRDFKQAILFFSEAIKNNPKHQQAYTERARAFSEMGNFNLAVTDISKAISLDKKSPFLYGQRGYFKSQLKNYQDAITDYNTALRLDPKDAWIYSSRGLDTLCR